MHRHRPHAIALIAVLTVASCAMTGSQGPSAINKASDVEMPLDHSPAVVNIVASIDALSLAHGIVDGYTASERALSSDIAIRTNAAIAATVLTAEADLGIVALPILQGEDVQIPDAWHQADPTHLGWDAIVVVMHPLRQVEGWDLAQLESVLCGEIRDWSQLGSGAGNIAVLGRAEGSPAREGLEELLGIKELIPRMELFASDAAICDAIATRPLALGWVTHSSVTDSCQSLPLDGVPPSPRALRGSNYPLRLAMILLTAPDAVPEARALADWIQSPAGQAFIAQQIVPTP